MNYIAGYEKVTKEMMQPLPSKLDISIDEIIEQTIPIYTLKKPNPKSGKEDCPVTVKEKEGFRMMMKIKLEAAKSDKERQGIIDKYKKMFE